MLYHAREGHLSLGNLQMDYLVFGSGTRPLVLLQGLNTRGIRGAAAGLDHMYRLFTKNWRVYLFDRRENVPEDFTVRQIAADVAAAMDALGLQQADVLAVSQGGMAAQYLAIDRPDLVRRMVLALTLSRTNDTVREAIDRWIHLTETNQAKALVTDMTERMYSPAYIRRYRPMLPLLTFLQKPRDPTRFITLARACLTCSAYEELDRIKCPVLVIGAEQDLIVTGGASREIAERTGGRLYMYPDLGHAAYEEAPDFNQRVYDFLME